MCRVIIETYWFLLALAKVAGKEALEPSYGRLST